jgi:hypothetical protein
MAYRHSSPGFQYRCALCHKAVIVRSPLSHSRSLCAECAAVEPGAWRTVYDRDKGLGELPFNLKARMDPP